jgi:multidrug transporter EmrE-like cation transporter
MSGMLLLVICIFLTAAASYFLKLAALEEASRGGLLSMATNPYTILGGICYATTFGAYAIALQKVPLSLAQPVITAGASVVATLLSVFLLREGMALVNWAGLLLVCLGIYLIFLGRL